MKKIIIASIAALTVASALSADVNGKACTSCHGADWSKSALGKSKIVSTLTHAEIATALKGYKDGSYGGPMKGLMKGQVAKYSDAELEAFAQTIGK
ncbi:MAG: cytochrome C [Sulfurimonas sp.]|jgi:cytochrome c|nr:cytochrome C [Sulfurimonas sp.]MBU1217796.1 cytochrome C [bacterium]MBU1433405.1 cytochrome C [bacterium]MBU1503399.1 cytochrome C [bacterium]MBU3940015.1 cytochrome C [bacterium]